MKYNKLSLNTLTKLGLSMHVLKVALAAGISYGLALSISENAYPIFAPLAAILTLQASIADSILKGIYRVLGVIIGVTIGATILIFFSISALSVFIAMLLSFSLSTAFQLNPQVISQVGVSALLVMGYGQENGYMIGRIIETFLGAVTAVLINLSFHPLNPLDLIKQAILNLSDNMASALENMSAYQDIEKLKIQLLKSRELVTKTEKEREDFLNTLNALRSYPFPHRKGIQLNQYIQTVNKLERLSIQVRGIARSLHDLKILRKRDYDFTRIFQDTSTCIKLFGESRVRPTKHLIIDLRNAIDEARKNQQTAYFNFISSGSPEYIPEIGSIFTDLARILDEIESKLPD